MASTWRFALCLCSFLLLTRTPSLASSAEGDDSTSSDEHGEASSPDSETGHEVENKVENITTLPIVSWKWHHIETPYMVALWVLVGWLCKLGES